MVEYVTDDGLQRLVDQLIRLPDFSALAERGIFVKAMLKVDMDDDNEYKPCKGAAAQLKPTGPIFLPFVEAPFVLTYDAGVWHNHPDKRESKIHKELMRIDFKDQEDGGTKWKTRKPNIVEFSKTIQRFGAYTEDLESLARITENLLPAELVQ